MTKKLEEKPPAVIPVISPMAQYAKQFQEVFENMVDASKKGHTGDIVPRAQPYET